METLTIGLFLICLALNREKLHYVNIFEDGDELYELRESSSVGGYVVAWLRSAFLPLMFVVYLKRKNYLKYVVCFVSYLLLFMMDKQKMTFFYPFLLTSLYYFVTYNDSFFKKYFHLILVFIFIVVPLCLMANLENPIIYTIAAFFIMRTMCIEGMETLTYLNFFEIHNHPFTYYNHINFVNAITHANPYSESIGIVVTQGGANANGIFWLMDGIAAAGVLGVLIISVFFVLIKSVINSMDARCSTALCVCIMLNGIQSMINVSLFTALNSCGFIVLYVIFLFFDLNVLTEKKVAL